MSNARTTSSPSTNGRGHNPSTNGKVVIPTTEQFEKTLAGLDPSERVNYLGELLKGMKRNEECARGETEVNATLATPPTQPATPTAPATASTTAKGRDGTTGRFTTGNRAARGNPFFRRMAALRSTLLDEIGEVELRKLVRVLFERACQGDVAAAGLVLKYTLGKPGSCVDPDQAELNEWQLLDACPSKSEILRALVDSVPADLATELLLKLLPAEPKEAKAKVFEDKNTIAIAEERKRRRKTPPAR